MGRNRLEKVLFIHSLKTNTKSIAIVLTSWLIFIVKKSNYREYIKNEFNFCKLDKKVLPRLLASRVLASAKILYVSLLKLGYIFILNNNNPHVLSSGHYTRL